MAYARFLGMFIGPALDTSELKSADRRCHTKLSLVLLHAHYLSLALQPQRSGQKVIEIERETYLHSFFECRIRDQLRHDGSFARRERGQLALLEVERRVILRPGQSDEDTARRGPVEPQLAFVHLLDRLEQRFCGLFLAHQTTGAPQYRGFVHSFVARPRE